MAILFYFVLVLEEFQCKMKGSRCVDDEGWRTHEIRWQETKRRHASEDVIWIIIFILDIFLFLTHRSRPFCMFSVSFRWLIIHRSELCFSWGWWANRTKLQIRSYVWPVASCYSEQILLLKRIWIVAIYVSLYTSLPFRRENSLFGFSDIFIQITRKYFKIFPLNPIPSVPNINFMYSINIYSFQNNKTKTWPKVDVIDGPKSRNLCDIVTGSVGRRLLTLTEIWSWRARRGCCSQ